jgi:hypothetical protein
VIFGVPIFHSFSCNALGAPTRRIGRPTRSKSHATDLGQSLPDRQPETPRSKDGSVLDHHVEHATGSKYKPMSDEDISKKFMDAGQALLSHDALSRIVDMTANLGAVKDVAELVELTTVRP